MTETTTNLVIDLTHGGVKIAINLAKKGEKVYAYDIYNTLKIDEKKLLKNYKVELIQLKDINKLKNNLKVKPHFKTFSTKQIIGRTQTAASSDESKYPNVFPSFVAARIPVPRAPSGTDRVHYQ